MPTVIPFIPSNISVPTLNVTLDGDDYSVTVTWNISAQRYYINIYGSDGTWITTVPLVSTPPGRNINTVVFDPFLSRVTVTMVDPLLWPVPLSPAGLATPAGIIIDYTLEGFDPDTYNGTFRGMNINETTFVFPMATDPGPVVIVGNVNRLMNMAAGVFTTSSLIYRNGAFEINP